MTWHLEISLLQSIILRNIYRKLVPFVYNNPISFFFQIQLFLKSWIQSYRALCTLQMQKGHCQIVQIETIVVNILHLKNLWVPEEKLDLMLLYMYSYSFEVISNVMCL